MAGRPLLGLLFDAPLLDPDVIGQGLELRCQGRPWPLEPAPTPARARWRHGHDEAQWLCARPTEPLEPMSSCELIAPPDEEGTARRWSFRTAAALELVEMRAVASAVCDPDGPWVVRMTTPLREDFDPDWLTLEPPPLRPPRRPSLCVTRRPTPAGAPPSR